MKKVSLVAVALLLASGIMFGQLKKGGMAIYTGLSGTNIGGSYGLSETMRLNVGIGFSSTSPSAGSSTSNFGVEGSVWMYNPAMENVTMFYGGGINFGSNNNGVATSSSFGVAVAAGAEYWFSPRFAWSGWVQAGFSSSGPSGATSSTFGTQGVGNALSWWFN